MAVRMKSHKALKMCFSLLLCSSILLLTAFGIMPFYFDTCGVRYSRDSAVRIATGYGLDDLEGGVRVPVGSRIFTSPCRPDRLWGPPNLLYNGYGELFPGGKAAGA
jgi:hypothetical protein